MKAIASICRVVLVASVASVVAASAPGCGGSRSARTIRTPDTRVVAVAHATLVTTYETALASIRAAIDLELGVSVPAFDLVICPDREALAVALTGTSPPTRFARRTAETMDAVGQPGRILVNGAVIDAMEWRSRIVLLAHEIVHVLQYDWAGGRRGESDQWLREGFAEWVTWRVADRLGLQASGPSASRRTAEVGRLPPERWPRLTELRTFPAWLRWVASRDDGFAYAHAAVAAGRLVQRHGPAAVVDYFRRFTRPADGEAAFEAAFGQSVDAFDRELRDWYAAGRTRR